MSNTILGSDGITIRQGIYQENENKMTDLGRFIDFEDGRRFRYCKASGAISIARVCMAPGPDSDHVAQIQTAYGLSVGDKDNLSIKVNGAPTANQYADGLLVVSYNGVTGGGQSYRIRKNTATNPVKVWLYDPIKTAVDATCDITLMKNKYLDVVVAPSPILTTSIGVPLIAITAGGYYFWAQTRGYAAIMSETTDSQPVIADNVVVGTGGVVKASGDVSNAVLGVCVYIPDYDEYCIVDLHLE